MDNFGLYETSSNEQFDDILTLACSITGCRSAYISILDEKWQNIRYTKNFKACQQPIDVSICKLTVENRSLFQVDDINSYPGLNNSILRSEQELKFYIGLPIIDKTQTVLGTLCVLDISFKLLTFEQKRNLEILGKQVLTILELREINLKKKKREKAEEENRVFFDVSSSLICILNDKMEIITINNAAFDIFGYKPEECKGLNFEVFLFPEDLQRTVVFSTQKLREKVKSFELETRIIAKNNDVKWIRWNVTNKNRKWFIIGREITKEKETRKSLKQLLAVANKINSGIVISNPKSEVLFVNPAFTEITQYGLSDFNGERLGDVLAGDGTNIETVRQRTRNKLSSSEEFLAYRKDGKKIWIAVHASVILDKKGDIDSLVEIIIDITKRKESEKQLELLSLVASKTNNGVSIYDTDGKVSWINEALENILGYNNEDVVGKSLVDLVKGEDTDMELLEIVREKASRLEPFNIEYKVYRKDGAEIWISVANTPIYNQITNQHTQVEIINDITQRKEAEMQLLASREEALRLSKAKESFVSVMSHEIRTPLNAVIGLANILNDEDKLPGQEQSINLLKFSADNLLNLINDILDFNKIEVGKMELENKRLDVRSLLKDIVASMQFKTDSKPIKIAYHIDKETPRLVRGDKTRLYQILVNLINNAIKFTEEGKVEINVSLAPEVDNKITLNFKITDTGIGISAEKLTAIFEPFTQAESNTTRKYGGSGLGLSISKKLINLFGGEIAVKSELGVGTEFSFNLKFNKFEGPLDMVETQQKITLEGKILVVDDNEINTLLAQRVLTKFGLTIVTTNSGINAIELLKAKDFDLVLMDVHMPDLNGYETTEKLRGFDDEYYKKLPIIALTASILEDHLDEIEKCGMTDFQLKPFKPDELARKIAKYITPA